jgi:membrane-bound lytic murein transglycosylase B
VPAIRFVLPLLFAAVMLLPQHAAGAAAPQLRPEVDAFIDEMVSVHGHERDALRQLFAGVKVRESILRAMSAPATARPWFEFRRRMVDSLRVEAGVRFWTEHAATLERAGREFGVPPEIIVATIGIETLYGRHMGNVRVLDALATLAFDYPPRAQFFRGELEQYLLLVREAPLDPLVLRGSFAGAIGIPQFLPSSYRKYAVDFDGDGRVDLVNSVADAIGSVANYYRSFGWRTGAGVLLPAEAGEADLGPLLAGGIKPHITVREVRDRGVVIQASADPDDEVTVFRVETEDGTALWLGLHNFYVITRYNRSINYAMAVHELAERIKAQTPVRPALRKP